MEVQTRYRLPLEAPLLVVQTDRPGRPSVGHRAARLDGALLTREACNLDQAANLVETTSPPARLCRRCFPAGTVS